MLKRNRRDHSGDLNGLNKSSTQQVYFTPNKFIYIHIMLHNVCIVIFRIEVQQQLSRLLGTPPIALLALELEGWVPITTRHGSYGSHGS